ncbi:Xaa-Pro aminopeptidase [Gammaproteobacteria bacterium]
MKANFFMNPKEFLRRRRRFLKMVGPGTVAMLATNIIHRRNRDTEYPFRPDSDFYYLTGFSEPEAVLVMIPGRPEGESLLFCRERNQEKEMWTGPRIGIEGAKEVYGMDEAYPIDKLDEMMPSLLENHTRLYYTLGLNSTLDTRVISWISQVRRKTRTGVRAPSEVVDLERVLHEQRLFKEPSELKRMRKAARIAARAHQRAMQTCQPGMREYQLEAELLHEFTRAGARATAYESIVAAGNNACVLHYSNNDSEIQDGDLVLIDAGCEVEYYASDISRTFPANGRFTEAQRQLYDLVLKAQRAAIDEVRPGRRWNDPHDTAVRIITKGLVALGLLDGKVKDLVKEENYKRFYMHRTGHWLGMDVHDVGEYKVGGEWRELKPGMVLTIEPGIYIPREAEGVPEKYWGIGIRIEDDCLVTETEAEVLTASVPTAPEEIESLMAKRH